jgi:ABC-2 type transport system permease protein
MPSWLQGFASNQPSTAVADALRALLNGTPVGAAAWHAVTWSIGIAAASVLLAGVLYRRRAG